MNRCSPKFCLRRRCRFWIVAGLALVWPAVALRAQSDALQPMPPPAPRRPSILLILADNVGWGDLGCYGQKHFKTPNLDQLAADGLRFTSYYTGSPEEAAARAAWMTGMEPHHLHAGFNQILPAEAATLPGFLKQQGYHTCLIGTWGLGDNGGDTPKKRGFDEFAGFFSPQHARDYYTDTLWRQDPDHGEARMVFPENEYGKHGKFMPDLIATAAINFLGYSRPTPLNQYRPFFLCLSYPIPHVAAESAPPGQSEYGDAPWPPLERIRAALISRMDEGIGRVLKKLDDLKISTNTVVVFASLGGPQTDGNMVTNFFNSTGPWRGQQGSLNEGGLRVPMLIRWPAAIAAGRSSELPCAAWDLLPTAAEIAYRPPPKNLDGISFLPTLLGETQTNRHTSFYWETRAGSSQQALRLGDWKAIRTAADRPIELFNLKTDSAETNNVATNHLDVLAKIKTLLPALGTGGSMP